MIEACEVRRNKYFNEIKTNSNEEKTNINKINHSKNKSKPYPIS